MSASWRKLAQIKTSGPIPQAPDSISWGWSPAIGVSDEPLGDADAGGLGAQENPGVLIEGGAVPGSGGAAPLVSHLKWLKCGWTGWRIPPCFPRMVATKAAGNCRTQEMTA